jgi:hypothetical protein
MVRRPADFRIEKFPLLKLNPKTLSVLQVICSNPSCMCCISISLLKRVSRIFPADSVLYRSKFAGGEPPKIKRSHSKEVFHGKKECSILNLRGESNKY